MTWSPCSGATYQIWWYTLRLVFEGLYIPETLMTDKCTYSKPSCVFDGIRRHWRNCLSKTQHFWHRPKSDLRSNGIRRIWEMACLRACFFNMPLMQKLASQNVRPLSTTHCIAFNSELLYLIQHYCIYCNTVLFNSTMRYIIKNSFSIQSLCRYL